MPYDPVLVQPMREELSQIGVEELLTPQDVDAFMSEQSGTALLIVNSVCGCAAGNARPGVRLALEHSNNMVTELIGQVAARHLDGEAKDLAGGALTLSRWLRKRLPDTAWDGFRLPNHSGLSSKARVTPRQMAAIVRLAAGRRYGGGGYLSLLPASGLGDSMHGRFRDPATALKIWAKTGTLKYAKGFTGILFTQQGRQVAFALYVTDFRKRLIYDVTTDALEPAPAARAEDWIRRAEALEEDLVREWIIGF
ncbi:MAG: BrxA/BrxB family bacilliredoxin [Proteobacteria bacterium]|nr:BrxA/BrxB family bacilliredoxin [Pseudomonadota bacterium]